MRILALTRYGNLGASSRLRMGQFAPALKDLGLEVEVRPLLDDAYLADAYAGRESGSYNDAISGSISMGGADLAFNPVTVTGTVVTKHVTGKDGAPFSATG